uniref:Phospholipase B-like n=2 Tax=Meloidogyne incognita TaxID=6306 RepID=A0A914N694_MELIC
MQAYAAGLVEGLLTKVQIYYHYLNTVSQLCKNAKEYCLKLFNYLKLNLEWIESQVMSNPPTDLYWRHVNLTYTQLTGIQDGYGPEKQFYLSRVRFAITPILKIQLAGDFFDLDRVFKKPKTNNYSSNNHCSGFVKVLEGNKDILISHVTMLGYKSMNRMLKLYKLAYDPKEVPGHTISISSYPGSVTSQDDFSLTSGGLGILETTITLSDESIYSNINPIGQINCWLRSLIANQLAKTSHEWVLDYKLFKPAEELPKNDLFWILEQIPGTTVSRDMTWFLRKYNYWPSYNIPFLKKISDLGGFTEKANINNWWRWGYSPRAKIFQRDHNKVKDMETLRELMRYNDYKHDEYSKCKCDPPYTADGGISTRSDLNPLNGTWELPDMGFKNEGTIDYKGTNYKLFNKFQFEVIGGPIHGGPSNLPPFNWKNTTIDALHYGQPIIWKFKNFTIEWQTELEPIII